MVVYLWGKREKENSQVKSWSHPALEWKRPADTNLILNLRFRPLIYLRDRGGNSDQNIKSSNLVKPGFYPILRKCMAT